LWGARDPAAHLAAQAVLDAARAAVDDRFGEWHGGAMRFATKLTVLGVVCWAAASACGGVTTRHVMEPDAGEGGVAEGGAAGASAGTTALGGTGGDAGAAGSAGASEVAYVPQVPTGCAGAAPYTRLSPSAEGIVASGLKLWLRADVGLSLDPQNGVCLWEDQSPGHHDVSQDTAASRPRAGATLGGRAALTTDGDLSLSRSDVLGIAPTSGRTIMAVYALDTPGKRFSILQGDPTTNYAYVGLDDNTFDTVGNRFGCYETAQSYDSDAVTDTLPHVRTQLIDTLVPGLPVADHMRCRKDSADLALTYLCCDASKLTGDLSTADETFIPDGGDATLAEVLIYDGALGDTDLAQVESSLRARYGLTAAQ
jgi:hypothetical protein